MKERVENNDRSGLELGDGGAAEEDTVEDLVLKACRSVRLSSEDDAPTHLKIGRASCRERVS